MKTKELKVLSAFLSQYPSIEKALRQFLDRGFPEVDILKCLIPFLQSELASAQADKDCKRDRRRPKLELVKG